MIGAPPRSSEKFVCRTSGRKLLGNAPPATNRGYTTTIVVYWVMQEKSTSVELYRNPEDWQSGGEQRERLIPRRMDKTPARVAFNKLVEDNGGAHSRKQTEARAQMCSSRRLPYATVVHPERGKVVR